MEKFNNPMITLQSLGFEYAGEWKLDFCKLKCFLQRHQSKNHILYAFVCDYQVFYIGKSILALSKRMMGYQNPGPTQRTNIHNHARLLELLQQGKRVEIFVFAPTERLDDKGIPVDLAAGLEDNLIELLSPP
jgi:hypothetical protein